MESNQEPSMNLVLSTDAKPRLKWTSQLHHRFVEAVDKLGGPDKATPKGLMKMMGIPGLTLYHLKSHLQKYRIGKSQKFGGSCVKDKQEDVSATENHEDRSNDGPEDVRDNVTVGKQDRVDESKKTTETLHEQIEVQRHLQVMIEAQGKYLQCVLKKAQETLAGHSSSTLGVDFARAELSRLASMVNKGCSSSSISELTEAEEEETEEERGFLGSKIQENAWALTRCSVESSPTSLDSTETTRLDSHERVTRGSVELVLMETKPEEMNTKKGRENDAVCKEQQQGKRALGIKEEDDTDDHLRLCLSSYYRKDMETFPNIGLGLN